MILSPILITVQIFTTLVEKVPVGRLIIIKNTYTFYQSRDNLNIGTVSSSFMYSKHGGLNKWTVM